MLQADIIGALFVLGFLRFGLPPEDRVQLIQVLPQANVVVFAGVLLVVFTSARRSACGFASGLPLAALSTAC